MERKDFTKKSILEYCYSMYKSFSAELDSIKERDPAADNKLEIALLYSGVHAVAAYRSAHFLYKNNLKVGARLICQAARFLTGIEIHPGATIGRNLFIDHGSAVVIGETAEIGDNCTIYQGVTLGGTGISHGKRHPTLGNNVMVGAGAKILGPIKIGDNVKIASGAVVLNAVPDNCTAVGIPARIVKKDGKKIQEDKNDKLDQIHIPDPIAQQMCVLEHKIELLEKKLNKSEGDNK